MPLRHQTHTDWLSGHSWPVFMALRILAAATRHRRGVEKLSLDFYSVFWFFRGKPRFSRSLQWSEYVAMAANLLYFQMHPNIPSLAFAGTGYDRKVGTVTSLPYCCHRIGSIEFIDRDPDDRLPLL